VVHKVKLYIKSGKLLINSGKIGTFTLVSIEISSASEAVHEKKRPFVTFSFKLNTGWFTEITDIIDNKRIYCLQ